MNAPALYHFDGDVRAAQAAILVEARRRPVAFGPMSDWLMDAAMTISHLPVDESIFLLANKIMSVTQNYMEFEKKAASDGPPDPRFKGITAFDFTIFENTLRGWHGMLCQARANMRAASASAANASLLSGMLGRIQHG